MEEIHCNTDWRAVPVVDGFELYKNVKNTSLPQGQQGPCGVDGLRGDRGAMHALPLQQVERWEVKGAD